MQNLHQGASSRKRRIRRRRGWRGKGTSRRHRGTREAAKNEVRRGLKCVWGTWEISARAVSTDERRWKAEWGVCGVEERFGCGEALRETAPSRCLASLEEQQVGWGVNPGRLFCFGFVCDAL